MLLYDAFFQILNPFLIPELYEPERLLIPHSSCLFSVNLLAIVWIAYLDSCVIAGLLSASKFEILNGGKHLLLSY